MLKKAEESSIYYSRRVDAAVCVRALQMCLRARASDVCVPVSDVCAEIFSHSAQLFSQQSRTPYILASFIRAVLIRVLIREIER